MIIIHTNLDRYSSQDFPKKLQYVPRVGEFVELTKEAQQKVSYPYPNKLQVTDVVHSETHVIVELWYSETQLKLIRLNKKDL